jgi:cytochrome c-type biogenesis protein CcmH
MMARFPLGLFAFLLAFLLAGPASAVKPDEMLKDPALEARARALSEGLRCMVCQNQSIDESDADLARDLRILVRQRLKAGDTDQQVLDYIVSRYGEFVLLKPRFDLQNALLWGTPVLLLLAGGMFMLWSSRGRRSPPAPLSSEEQVALDAALKRD